MTAHDQLELVTYKECRRNLSLESGDVHLVDGCRHFVLGVGPAADAALLCQVCGCHRNFHRREVSLMTAHDVHHPQPPPQRPSLVPTVVLALPAPPFLANPNYRPPRSSRSPTRRP